MGKRLGAQVVGGDMIHSSSEFPGRFQPCWRQVQNTKKRIIIYQSHEEDVTVNGSGEKVQGYQKESPSVDGIFWKTSWKSWDKFSLEEEIESIDK